MAVPQDPAHSLTAQGDGCDTRFAAFVKLLETRNTRASPAGRWWYRSCMA